MIDKLKKKELCRERYHQLVAGYIYIYIPCMLINILLLFYIPHFPKLEPRLFFNTPKTKTKKPTLKTYCWNIFRPQCRY